MHIIKIYCVTFLKTFLKFKTNFEALQVRLVCWVGLMSKRLFWMWLCVSNAELSSLTHWDFLHTLPPYISKTIHNWWCSTVKREEWHCQCWQLERFTAPQQRVHSPADCGNTFLRLFSALSTARGPCELLPLLLLWCIRRRWTVWENFGGFQLLLAFSLGDHHVCKYTHNHYTDAVFSLCRWCFCQLMPGLWNPGFIRAEQRSHSQFPDLFHRPTTNTGKICEWGQRYRKFSCIDMLYV